MTSRGVASFVRVAAVAFAILFAIVGLIATWTLFRSPLPIDFLSFWAASRLVLSGHATAAYDVQAHHAAEALSAPIRGLLPFGYPPPFLLLITPLALVSYWLSFAFWLALTGIIYVRLVARPGLRSVATAHPSVLANFLVGQNGFVTTSIVSAGLRFLPVRPFLAGVVLGLLVIKPQLGLVLPFAMIAGREWKAVAGAIVSASCALMAALAAFGAGSYRSFIAGLPLFTRALEGSVWPWNDLASVFALLRFIGVEYKPALIAQAVIAFIVIGLTCRAWWLRLDERGPILAASTLLATPYLFTYDALLLAIPLLWLIERRQRLWAVGAIWFLCLLPVAVYFHLYTGPNTIPVAALLCLWALCNPGCGSARAPSGYCRLSA